MSNSKDQNDPGNKVDPDKPYVVGNKKPPLHTRFKPGQSGNPRGRPKGRPKDLANFGELLMKEFYKQVPALIAGKTVIKSQGEIVANQMVKNAITTKQPAYLSILLKFIEAHEQRQALRDALKLKQINSGAVKIDWDEEKKKIYQDLMIRAGKIGQSSAPNV
jgi:hypothetical protein